MLLLMIGSASTEDAIGRNADSLPLFPLCDLHHVSTIPAEIINLYNPLKGL